MRVLAIVGVLFIVFGVATFTVQEVTYFTSERVVDAGPVKIDVQRPHTIIFNPIAGGVAVAAEIVLVVVGARARTA